MKNVFLYVKACERRKLDAAKIRQYLVANDYTIVDKPQDADTIIFVTCGYTDEATKDCLRTIEHFQEYNAELIVAGCVPDIDEEKLKEIFKGRTLSTKHLETIDSLFNQKQSFSDISNQHLSFYNIDSDSILGVVQKIFTHVPQLEHMYLAAREYLFRHVFGDLLLVPFHLPLTKKALYHLQISNGCLGNCSYCVIKKAIGQHKSKPLGQCIDEFQQGLRQGYSRFVITADDVGAYGIDIDDSFPHLLDELTQPPGTYYIDILSLNPRWLVKYIDELETTLKRRKIRCVEVPIQSTSPRILKLMNRYANIEKIRNAFLRLKETSPDVLLQTHYILGFPTETKEEVLETISFIIDLEFDAGYIFTFSCKTGSRSEQLEPKISQSQIKQRLKLAKRMLKKAGYNIFTFKLFVIFEKKNK